jgi:hypothetical protein
MPTGLLDGINYNTADASKATLARCSVEILLTIENLHLLFDEKRPDIRKFWLELTGLTSGVNYTYQYWVGETPLIPRIGKTSDPYSTLVLSPYDGGIPAATYPNMPVYPVGQEREVTVLQTGQTPIHGGTTNFVKPEKDKLVVYELLVRDFDAGRNYKV